jgi:hypothetical protein
MSNPRETNYDMQDKIYDQLANFVKDNLKDPNNEGKYLDSKPSNVLAAEFQKKLDKEKTIGQFNYKYDDGIRIWNNTTLTNIFKGADPKTMVKQIKKDLKLCRNINWGTNKCKGGRKRRRSRRKSRRGGKKRKSRRKRRKSRKKRKRRTRRRRRR